MINCWKETNCNFIEYDTEVLWFETHRTSFQVVLLYTKLRKMVTHHPLGVAMRDLYSMLI